MGLQLSDERKLDVARALRGFFLDEFDNEMSEFQAAEVVDFMLKQIGPSQYNQAIGDARNFLMEKIEELDVTLYEPEIR